MTADTLFSDCDQPRSIFCSKTSQCFTWGAVLNGMDLVKKIEGEGTGSGKPKKQVKISKSGELSKKQWV